MYTAENPARSTNLAVAALKAPGISTHPSPIKRRSKVVFRSDFIKAIQKARTDVHPLPWDPATGIFARLILRSARRHDFVYSRLQIFQELHKICNCANQPFPDMSKSKKPKFDLNWAKAKNLCRLNMEDIRMAKALGISPKGLMKNNPSPSERWKEPVKYWIRGLYEKRFGG